MTPVVRRRRCCCRCCCCCSCWCWCWCRCWCCKCMLLLFCDRGRLHCFVFRIWARGRVACVLAGCACGFLPEPVVDSAVVLLFFRTRRPPSVICLLRPAPCKRRVRHIRYKYRKSLCSISLLSKITAFTLLIYPPPTPPFSLHAPLPHLSPTPLCTGVRRQEPRGATSRGLSSEP